MRHTSPASNVHVYRIRLRVLLLAVITVAIGWSALTSHSARRNEPSVEPNPAPVASHPPQKQPEGEKRAALDKYYGNLPLSFEENRGQTDASVKYVARGPGYNISLTAAEAVFVLKDAAGAKSKGESADPEGGIASQSHRGPARLGEGDAADRAKAAPTVLRVSLKGANTNQGPVEGIEQLEGKVNYFMGNDSSKWLTDIPTYRKVVYRDAYPGIDMVYYGNRQQLEYDFVVAPGADASVVALKYEGAQDIRVDREGNLVLKTTAGELRQLKPVVYQEINGQRKEIEGRYQMRGKNSVGFRLSRYDQSKPLVIDPILVYSSLVNAGGYASAIAVDNNGYAYITGFAYEDFNPTAGAFQTTKTGDYCAFVTKVNQTGTDVVYSTFIGGNGQAEAFGIAVDSSGQAYITGYASGTFPTTVGSYQPVRASDFDCFVTKFNASGSGLVYSTFYGGAEFDEGLAITIDGTNTYVTGDSNSRNLPVTGGVVQSTNRGGSEAFVFKLNSTGSGLLFATYIGGGGSEIPLGIAIDSATNVYLAGETSSLNFTQVNGLQSAGGVDRGFFRSANSGATWTLSNSGLLNLQIHAIAINPTTPNIQYAGSLGGVSRSTDGGATWSPTGPIPGAVRALAIDPTNTATIYAGAANGVYKTTNSGDSWTAVNNGIFFQFSGVNYPVQVRTIAINPTNPAIIYVGANLGVYKSTDSGATWIRLSGNGLVGSSFWSVVIDPTNPSTIYLGANSSGVLKSTDSGFSWTAMNSGLTAGFPRNIRSLAIVPSAPSTLYAGTLAGIFKTTDGGNSWNAVNNGLLVPFTDLVSRPPTSVNAIVVNPATPTTIYAGSTNNSIASGAFPLTAIFKSTDGGATWTALTSGFGSLNNGILALAINPATPALVSAGTTADFDGFAAKINASGSSYTYSTYVGGNRNDYFAGIVADAGGNSYLYGGTASANLPVTPGAFDSTLGGSYDTFAMKLNPSGTARLYSTYLGGSLEEDSFGLAVDSGGNAHVFGWTKSTDFPVTPGAFQSSLASRGSISTAGTTGTSDAFVTKLNATGTGLVYSSYLGGSGDELFDFEGNNIALDSLGNAYVAGVTGDTSTFPAFGFANAFSPQYGPGQTFVAKIASNTPSYSITGRIIRTGANAPIAGVVVTASNTNFSRSTKTDVDGYYSIVSLPAADYTVTPGGAGSPAGYVFTPQSQSFPALSSNQVANFTGDIWQSVVLTGAQIIELKAWTVGGRTSVYVKPQFPDAGYRVANWGVPARVGNDFTVDASVEKSTLPSIQAALTTAQIYDLGPIANGTYNFNFKTSGTLAKTLQFVVSSTAPPPNPIDDARTFVRQQYRDFLNREADQAGEDFWTDNITKCNDPARRPPGQTVEQCTLRQRETTSGAFFQSPEFLYTGYFVYRMYQGTLGRQPKLSEFIPDAQFVGNGIIVGGQLSAAVINANKAAFAAQFVDCVDATKHRCAEFKAIYELLTNQEFVDKLFQTTGVNASAADRATLVNGLNAATETRATVVQKVVDGINVIAEGNQQFTTTYGQAFYNAEFNRAFVLLEYFGYMKRDPDEAGYAFWLAKLNLFNGNFVNAEMVLAFISSPEYRARFGQP